MGRKIVNLYFVNANNNKLELFKQSKSYIIACGFGTLTKTKKELRKENRKRKREENSKNTTANSGFTQ